MGLAVPIVLLTTAAMFVRNLLILVLFSPAAAPVALWPMLTMAAGAIYFAWRRRDRTLRPAGELPLSSPVSLRKVLSFGMLFLFIAAIGTVGARFLGKYGFLIVSVFGGLVSSASTTAAAANLSMHGRLTSIVPSMMLQRCCSVWAEPRRFSQQEPVVMLWGDLWPVSQAAASSSWLVHRKTISN
jgi:uncharacterized membrane protein (DUF4010 family)